MNNTDNPTSRKNNVNSEVQKVEKNNQLLSSLKDKLSKLSNHIWLRKVELIKIKLNSPRKIIIIRFKFIK